MKKLIIYLGILFIVFFAACTKVEKTAEYSLNMSHFMPLVAGDSPIIYNYFMISCMQKANTIDSSYAISAMATFTDSITNQIQTVSSVMVNSRSLLLNANNTYSFDYSDSSATLSEGIALTGTSAKVKITGSSAADTVTSYLYAPKNLVRLTSDFPSAYIFTGNSLPITWVPDPGYSPGQIGIEVEYDSALSLLADSTLPHAVAKKTYQVTDNGSYTIPVADLAAFPVHSYLTIYTARGSQNIAVLPISHRRVFYYGLTYTATKELQVCSPCTSCTGTNHKCVAGICVTGDLYVTQTYNGGKCKTVTEYKFPDGTINIVSTVTVNGPCN